MPSIYLFMFDVVNQSQLLISISKKVISQIYSKNFYYITFIKILQRSHFTTHTGYYKCQYWSISPITIFLLYGHTSSRSGRGIEHHLTSITTVRSIIRSNTMTASTICSNIINNSLKGHGKTKLKYPLCMGVTF